MTRDIATEDTATILLRFENGARGAVSISQISAGPEELAPVRDRRLARVGRLGLRAARPAVDRPPRAAQRDPDQEPGAHGPGGPGRRRTAGWPRRGLRRHVRRPLPGRLRGRRGRRPSASPGYPTFADGHDEMLVNDADRRERPPRPLGRRRSRPGPGRRPGGGATPMRLGLLTAPFPETPLARRRRLDGGQRLRQHRDRVLAAHDRPDPSVCRHVPHRRREPVGRPGDRARRPDRRPRASRSPDSGYYPNPLHPDPEHRAKVIGHLKLVIEAAEAMGIP